MKGLRVTFRALLLRAAPRHAVITYVHGDGDVVGRCSHRSEGGDPAIGDPAIGAKTSEKARAREKTGKAATGGSQQVHRQAEDLSDRENNEVTQGLTERSLGWGAEDAAQVLG